MTKCLAYKLCLKISVLLLFLNYVLLDLNQIASSVNHHSFFLAESYCSLYWLQSAESSIFMHECSKHGVFINSFYHSGHLCPHFLVHRFIYSQNLRLSSNQHSEKKKKACCCPEKKQKTNKKKPFLSFISRINGKRSFIVCPVL